MMREDGDYKDSTSVESRKGHRIPVIISFCVLSTW